VVKTEGLWPEVHKSTEGKNITISRGAYYILFQSVLKVKTFLKIFCRENCVNIGMVAVVWFS
jgi:hypothetical protein